ncbi:phage minor capsid protein [Lacrimispora sp.]|uniref:phage minor capsid protein n=1 Tax=Lacrimispora sp. TaxID=2719234 RepID=UPI002859A617|nr:phage minor capsid protein [Lacrimispora sp.]MDR7814625.1 phage minor capsid protein [Lacrimispora sp.]
MTPDELEKLPKPIERIMTAMEMSIMAEIVERIENAGLITPLIDWTISRVSAIGESKARIKKIISDTLRDNDLQIDKIYEHAIKANYVTYKELYQAAGKDYVPYQENKWLQQIMSAIKAQTNDSLRPMENITQTTGFNVMVGKAKVFTPLSEYLEKTLDKAMMEITTGVKTYSQAINGVIDEMTSSGLRIVDYASGRSDRVEVAARRAVMTGVAQLTDKVNEKNAKELNTDYWEVEWHMGARNTGTGFMNHQSWQGKVYSSEEMRTVCGLGEMLGFAGINCYHIRFAFIPGISKRKYTDEWLLEQNRRENTKRTFNRKEYDTYGAIQYQRRLERTIRKLKQDIKLLKKTKADPDDISAVKIRLRVTSKIYTDLSKEMDIPQQLERIYTPKTASMQ